MGEGHSRGTKEKSSHIASSARRDFKCQTNKQKQASFLLIRVLQGTPDSAPAAS